MSGLLDHLRYGDAVFERLRAEKMARFKAASMGDAKTTEAPMPCRPWFGFGYSYETYRKRALSLKAGHRLEFITKPSAIFKQSSVIWRTQGEQAREAYRYGLLKPQTLTGTAIAAVGKYRLKAAERAIHSGIKSNKAHQKRALVNIFQLRVTKLEELERLINSGKRLNEVKVVISRYADSCRSVYHMDINHINHLFSQYVEGVGDYFSLAASKDSALARSLLERLTEENWEVELKLFLKNQIARQAHELQSVNEDLSDWYGGRGDLNSACDDAIRDIHRYQFDLHNPITPAHQYKFEDDEEVLIDSSYHVGDSGHALKDFFTTVTAVEGLENIEDVPETPYVKWKNWGLSHGDNIFSKTFGQRILALLWNNLAIGLFAFCEVLIFGEQARFFEKVLYRPKNVGNYKKLEEETNFDTMLAQLSASRTHFSYRFALFLRNKILGNVRKAIFGIAQGMFQGLSKFKQLKSDWENGYLNRSRLHRYDKNHLDLFSFDRKVLLYGRLARELKEITEAKEKLHNDFEKRLGGQEDEVADNLSSARFANPTYPLQAYHSYGLLTKVSDGVDEFFDLFEHNVFTKHPIAGAFFTALYASGAAAVLIPAKVSFLPKAYINFSHDLGRFFANGKSSETVASAFMQAKMGAASWEFVNHGADSWLLKGFYDFIKDPVVISISLSLCGILGYVLTYKLTIPWLNLQDDIGSFEPGALAFIGFKAGVIFYETFPGKDRARINAKSSYQEELYKVFEVVKKKKQGSDATLSDEDKEKISQIAGIMYEAARANKIGQKTKTPDFPELEAQKQQGINFSFLTLLSTYPNDLEHLSVGLQEDLREMLPDITDSQETADGIAQLFEPKKSGSPMRNFFSSIFSYLGIGGRCLLSIFTWSQRPWRDLWRQMKDDTTSIATALSQLIKKVLEMALNRFPRVVCDVFVNNGLIKCIKAVFGKQNCTTSLTNIAYQVSDKFDELQRELCATSRILDALRRDASTLHPHVALSSAIDQFVRKANSEALSYQGLSTTPFGQFFDDKRSKTNKKDSEASRYDSNYGI